MRPALVSTPKPARPPSLLWPLAATLTLGLAPFWPEPHIVKQLVNLAHGRLHAPIDLFDLVLHGSPWLWLLVGVGCRVRLALRPPTG